MVDVQFNTDNQSKSITSPSIGIVRAENRMAEWLIRKGIAKSELQAQYILFAIGIGALLIAIISPYFLMPKPPPIAPREGGPTTSLEDVPQNTAPASLPNRW